MQIRYTKKDHRIHARWSENYSLIVKERTESVNRELPVRSFGMSSAVKEAMGVSVSSSAEKFAVSVKTPSSALVRTTGVMTKEPSLRG